MARKCLSSDKEKRCSKHLGLGLMGYALPALGICHFVHGGWKCRCEAVFELRLGRDVLARRWSTGLSLTLQRPRMGEKPYWFRLWHCCSHGSFLPVRSTC